MCVLHRIELYSVRQVNPLQHVVVQWVQQTEDIDVKENLGDYGNVRILDRGF